MTTIFVRTTTKQKVSLQFFNKFIQNRLVFVISVALCFLLSATYGTLYAALVVTSNKTIKQKCPDSNVWWFVLFMCIWQLFGFLVTAFMKAIRKSQKLSGETPHSWTKCGIYLNHCLLVAVNMFFTFTVLTKLFDACFYNHFNKTVLFAIVLFVCVCMIAKWVLCAAVYSVAIVKVFCGFVRAFFNPEENTVAENESDGV